MARDRDPEREAILRTLERHRVRYGNRQQDDLERYW